MARVERVVQLLQDSYFPYSAANIGAEQYRATFAITQVDKQVQEMLPEIFDTVLAQDLIQENL